MTSGVIAEPEGILSILVAFVHRYEKGEINAETLDALLQHRIVPQLNKACWCAADVCCPAHDRHSTPHKRCILR